MDRDAEHLRLLSIFHYVLGGLHALFACFGMLYVLMGFFMVVAGPSMNSSNGPPPQAFGWIMVVFGMCFVLFGLALGGAMIYAGLCLSRRMRYVFCMVVACVSCLMFPFGTILGVCTIIVLQRPRVLQIFGRQVDYA